MMDLAPIFRWIPRANRYYVAPLFVLGGVLGTGFGCLTNQHIHQLFVLAIAS
ncbi:hypothetical protein C8R45DRAFT_1218400 [Mycena sanguinolenta]|nr:hypothetical protein C8R45DRAFT_1218400 [Mycena sanguinolenta]